MNPCFWDSESCYLSSDLAPDGLEIGWSLARRPYMGMAWAVTWTRADGFIHWSHRLVDLPGLQVRYIYDLPEYLLGAEHVFDYSGTGFDLELLEACITGEPIHLGGYTDVLVSIRTSMQRLNISAKWPSLDEVGRATIRTGKSMFGDAAPDLFRRGYRGDREALYSGARYCQRDVGVLRDLAYHISRYGYVVHPVGQVIPVSLPEGVAEWDASLIHPRHAVWRNDPVSSAQVLAIRRWYGHHWQPTPGLTKGQASDMIEELKKEAQDAEGGDGNQGNLHADGAGNISATPSTQNAATGLQGGKEAMLPGKACAS